MILEYIDAAMHKAKYEMLEDDGTFYGEIPECQGVWANAKTLAECRDQLEDRLEAWILHRISAHKSIPEIDHYNLNSILEEEAAAA